MKEVKERGRPMRERIKVASMSKMPTMAAEVTATPNSLLGLHWNIGNSDTKSKR